MCTLTKSPVIILLKSLSDTFTLCILFSLIHCYYYCIHQYLYNLIKQSFSVDPVKNIPLLPKCQCLCEKSIFHNMFAYYAGIMLDAFAILLCLK